MRNISLILSACIGLVLLQVVHGDEPAPIDGAASVLAVLKAQPDDIEANFELFERYLVVHEELMHSREDSAANRALLEKLNAYHGDGLEVGRYVQRLILSGKLPPALDKRARELNSRHAKLYGMMGSVTRGNSELFPYRSAGVSAEDAIEEADAAATARDEARAKWQAEKEGLLEQGIQPIAHLLQEAGERMPQTPSGYVDIVMIYLNTLREAERANREDVCEYLRDERFVRYFRGFARDAMRVYREEAAFNPKWREKEMLLLDLMTFELERLYQLWVVKPTPQAVESPWLLPPRRMSAPEIASVLPLLKELQVAVNAGDWGTVVNTAHDANRLVGKHENTHAEILDYLLKHAELKQVYQHAVPNLLADQVNFFVYRRKDGRYLGSVLVRRGTKVKGVAMPELYGLSLVWFPEYSCWGHQPILGKMDWVPDDMVK